MYKCNGTVQVLKEESRPQYKETILSLQYCKLHRKENESTQEWMGRFCIKAVEYNYREHDRMLKE